MQIDRLPCIKIIKYNTNTIIPKFIHTDLGPISLTAVLSKILESFVFNWLAPIVMPHIDLFQFGNAQGMLKCKAWLKICHLTPRIQRLRVFFACVDLRDINTAT